MNENSRMRRMRNFWERQIGPSLTRGQTVFDVLFGIVVPILCLIIDPIVFRPDPFLGPGILGGIQVFAYIAIGLGIISLSLWLRFRTRIKRASGFFAGAFLAGSIFAFIIGFPLAPFLISPFVVLAITPLLASFVFLRNGNLAFLQAQTSIDMRQLILTMTAGMILVIALPAAGQYAATKFISQGIEDALQDDPQVSATAIHRLQNAIWCPVICGDAVRRAYITERDFNRQQRFDWLYEQITGHSIYLSPILTQ